MTKPGLYLHIPFCAAICPYCDFAVTVGRKERRRHFVEALLAEVELVEAGGERWGRFDTLYFGGGTPSVLASDELARILEGIRSSLPLAEGCRIFLEANPEDVSESAVADWRRLGVETLSLGVQSFDAESLRFLGRKHEPGTARRAVEIAKQAGFRTVSLDLIFGLPGREPDGWERDLETAVALESDHVSCYQLTIHEGTPFGGRKERGALNELPEDDQAARFRVTHERLAAAGYSAYEVSNFARGPEHRSLHNRKYWTHAPYLGLGPSAHSYDGGRERWWNERAVDSWEARVRCGERPVAGTETLDVPALALEHLMLGLRTTEGVDIRRLDRDLGLHLREENRAGIADLTAEGLVTFDGDRLAPTLRGLAVADGLASLLTIR